MDCLRRMTRRWAGPLCLALGLIAFTVGAADQAPKSEVPPVAVAYLEDPTGQLTIEQVTSGDRAEKFVTTQKRSLNFGITDSAYWLRITIPANAPTLLVELASRNNTLVDFFRPARAGGFEVSRAGVGRPMSTWETAYRYPVFKGASDTTTESHHYLRVTAATNLEIPLRFWTEPGFRSAVATERFWIGVYLGIAAVMAVYNLFLYFGVRDSAYLWYVLWVLSLTAALALRAGFPATWLWTESPETYRYAMYVLLVVALPASIQFTRTLLETRTRTPRTDKFLWAIILYFPWILLPLALDYHRQSFVMIQIGVSLVVLGAMVAGVLALRQRFRPAGYFLVAFATPWVTVSGQVAQSLGLVSGLEFLAFQGVQIATTIEVVLFALALADRINTLKEAKERAQAEALAIQGRALAAAQRSEAELEQRVAERTDALARAKDQAQQANLAKTRFLAAASHDLRQPMHAIGLMVGALRERAGDPETRRLVDRIDGSVEAMDSLFNALLDISKLDSGSVVATPVDLRLQTLLDALDFNFAPQAQDKGLRLRVRRSDALVRSDPVLLDRILRNLVANALRYTERGGVLVGARRRGAALHIEVWDTGVGIAADKQALVFDEFVQLANPTRDRAKGLGLGLSIVKRLGDLLGHDIGLRSRPGKGSVFSVVLPYLGKAPARDETLVEAAPAADLRGAFVVVVDDEQDILEGMRSLLGEYGVRVACASSGPQAVAVLGEHLRAPDLIISDYRIAPDHTGIDVIRMIRDAQQMDIPAVLITGDSSAEDLEAAQASGLPVVLKPVSASRIRSLVAAAASAPPLGEA